MVDVHRLNNQHRGVLSGTPGNSDVGVKTMQWQALDDAGSTATYRLRLDVQNINDAPELRTNPDLRNLENSLMGNLPLIKMPTEGST